MSSLQKTSGSPPRLRPPGAWGPTITLVGAALVAVPWQRAWLGTGPIGTLALFIGAALVYLGVKESSRAFDAWQLVRSTHEERVAIVVRRRLLGRCSLELPQVGASASLYARRFAAVSASAWLVRAPAPVDFDAVIERRGLLSLGGVRIGDDAFDKEFVVRATNLEGYQLATLLPPSTRYAIARLLLVPHVDSLAFVGSGHVEVRLNTGEHDAGPFAALVPKVQALLQALGTRATAAPQPGLLRAHSPSGSPVGLG